MGVITNRDVTRALDPKLTAEGEELQVKQIAVLQAYVVDLVEPLDKVVLHMAKQHVDSALVVQDERLVGIFTVTDVCECLGAFLREMFPSDDDNVA